MFSVPLRIIFYFVLLFQWQRNNVCKFQTVSINFKNPFSVPFCHCSSNLLCHFSPSFLSHFSFLTYLCCFPSSFFSFTFLSSIFSLSFSLFVLEMSGALVLTKVDLMLLPFNNVSLHSPSTYSARYCIFTTLGGGSSPHARITICGLANFSSFPMATQLGVVFYLKINTLLSDPKVQMLNHYRIFSSLTPQLKSP